MPQKPRIGFLAATSNYLAPPGLLPRVAYRTTRRSPGSPRIRGTGRRSSPTKHAARNSSRSFVPPPTLPRHGGNETQGRTPAEEHGDLALPDSTFPRGRSGIPPGATQGKGLQSDPLGVCPPSGRLGQILRRIGPEELRLVSELTRERNNLNQLAFLQHAFGVASHEEELRRILRFYDEVIGRLKQKL